MKLGIVFPRLRAGLAGVGPRSIVGECARSAGPPPAHCGLRGPPAAVLRTRQLDRQTGRAPRRRSQRQRERRALGLHAEGRGTPSQRAITWRR